MAESDDDSTAPAPSSNGTRAATSPRPFVAAFGAFATRAERVLLIVCRVQASAAGLAVAGMVILLVGSLGAGGTLGILIPPSLTLIIYGSWMDVSIGRLFIAGVVPGIMLSTLFMVYIGLTAKLRPEIVPSTGDVMPFGAAIRRSAQAWPFVVLVFAVLGTIFLGLATPTESAALGVVAAMLLALLYRELSLVKLWHAAGDGGDVQHAGADPGRRPGPRAGDRADRTAEASDTRRRRERPVADHDHHPGLRDLCGVGLLGIVLVIVSETGLLTPPLGVNLFVMMAVTGGRVTLGETATACLPYWLLMLVLLAIITVEPQVVLVLPDFVR